MSKERLLSLLSESKLVGSENNVDNERLKKIRKAFNYLRDTFLTLMWVGFLKVSFEVGVVVKLQLQF